MMMAMMRCTTYHTAMIQPGNFGPSTLAFMTQTTKVTTTTKIATAKPAAAAAAAAAAVVVPTTHGWPLHLQL